jgi:hypothetical protein
MAEESAAGPPPTQTGLPSVVESGPEPAGTHRLVI